ncbi:MAG: hypothetical protein EOP49_03650 [Sphingobacteriales bacterium]|nr:MAG: hypothetical protein EOP49_03650 [Sphingobacteriales bacterium]
MTIADVGDYMWDSGVFISGSSFTSKPANTTAISGLGSKTLFISPNPFEDIVKVTLPDDLLQKKVSCYIVNEMGQSIYQYNGRGDGFSFSLASASKSFNVGNYILHFAVPADGTREVIRLQKH